MIAVLRFNPNLLTYTGGREFRSEYVERRYFKIIGFERRRRRSCFWPAQNLGSRLQMASQKNIRRANPLAAMSHNRRSTRPRTLRHLLGNKQLYTRPRIRNNDNCPQAFGTTGAFADRLCIATNGAFDQLLSAEELAFCCHECGDGCNGGYPLVAWNYFRRHGVVTGGNYNTTDVNRIKPTRSNGV